MYNWGQYIAEGDDDSIDVIDEFEKAYPNIHVNYTTYDSNETHVLQAEDRRHLR